MEKKIKQGQLEYSISRLPFSCYVAGLKLLILLPQLKCWDYRCVLLYTTWRIQKNHFVSRQVGDVNNRLTLKPSSSFAGREVMAPRQQSDDFSKHPNWGQELCFSFYAIRPGGEIIKGQKEKEQESPGQSKSYRRGEIRLRLVRDVPRLLIEK